MYPFLYSQVRLRPIRCLDGTRGCYSPVSGVVFVETSVDSVFLLAGLHTNRMYQLMILLNLSLIRPK